MIETLFLKIVFATFVTISFIYGALIVKLLVTSSNVTKREADAVLLTNMVVGGLTIIFSTLAIFSDREFSIVVAIVVFSNITSVVLWSTVSPFKFRKKDEGND